VFNSSPDLGDSTHCENHGIRPLGRIFARKNKGYWNKTEGRTHSIVTTEQAVEKRVYGADH
jgi:hypothetical protein